MRFPKKLEKGDTIGLICPSSAVTEERAEQCRRAILKMGYRYKAADNLDKSLYGLMAGTGEERGRWVNRMFADPEVDAIICLRGGDGGCRAMEYLDYGLIDRNPKIFCGFSDVTCMHIGITQNTGLVTFHGPMVSSNMVDDWDEESAEGFFSCVNAEGSFSFRNPKGFDIREVRSGRARGPLTGGNLSLIAASVGTPYQIDLRGRILFVEEVGEGVSKVEKWMDQIRLSGLLEGCQGILLGQFTHMRQNAAPDYDPVACIAEICGPYGIPIMAGLEAGHGLPNMTLPMGAVCNMDTAAGSIVFEVER